MRARGQIPTEVPFTADQLLDTIRARGGRIFRKAEVSVFCLTTDGDLAQWLLDMGGLPFQSAAQDRSLPTGQYERAKGGPIEWDIYIHRIPVKGDRTLWDAAGPAVYGARADIPPKEAA